MLLFSPSNHFDWTRPVFITRGLFEAIFDYWRDITLYNEGADGDADQQKSLLQIGGYRLTSFRHDSRQKSLM